MGREANRNDENPEADSEAGGREVIAMYAYTTLTSMGKYELEVENRHTITALKRYRKGITPLTPIFYIFSTRNEILRPS